MSGFTPRITITTPQIREWFGTSGNDPGLPNNQTGLLTTQDIAYGYEGDDTVDVGFSAVSQVYGGQGNDSLIGSPVFLSITNLFGDRGNDTIIMKGGTASFGSGGQGNDVLIGSEGSSIDSLFGGQDNDVIRGYSGSDFLSGDAGADIIWGDESLSGDTGNADMILGGTGSDSIVGGGGNDTIYGGQDNDYLEVDASLVRSGTPPVDRFPAGDAGVVSGNDRVFGDLGNDTIGRLGSSGGATGTDWYDGGEGNDSIQGGNNQTSPTINVAGDTLIGGNGNDTIRGGTTNSGSDSIVGGAGNDSISGGSEAGGQTLAAIITNGVLGGDTILGGDGDDNIQGEGGSDSIEGGIGNDFIAGGNDADWLLGGDQIDTITGGAGDDSIVGGNDADILEGGAGSDTLTGFNGTDNNDGTDRFVYNLSGILGSQAGSYSITTAGTVVPIVPPAVPPNPVPAGTTVYNNVPGAVAQTAADYITRFDVNQDVIQISSLTNVTVTTPTGTTALAFGGRPVNIGTTGGVLNPASATVGSTNIAASGTADSLIYIERDGLAGYDNADDIALVTLIGTAATTLGIANFV